MGVDTIALVPLSWDLSINIKPLLSERFGLNGVRVCIDGGNEYVYGRVTWHDRDAGGRVGFTIQTTITPVGAGCWRFATRAYGPASEALRRLVEVTGGWLVAEDTIDSWKRYNGLENPEDGDAWNLRQSIIRGDSDD